VLVDRHAGQVAERAWHAIGQELDLVADLVDHGTLAASLPAAREGGRAGSIVELAGDLEPGVDRNITLHGVLVRPSGAVLGVLAAAVADGTCGRWWTRCRTWRMRRWPIGGSSPVTAKARSCCA
jgi:hypothetical protein